MDLFCNIRNGNTPFSAASDPVQADEKGQSSILIGISPLYLAVHDIVLFGLLSSLEQLFSYYYMKLKFVNVDKD